MEASELKQKTDKELAVLLESKRRDLWNFRFGASGSKVRNVKEEKTLRREIARILSVLTGMKSATKK